MNKNHFLFSLLLLTFMAGLALVLEGCDSNDDTEYPVINVKDPLPGTIYENGDTIKFHAVFSDNAQLKNVELSLVDEDNKPMLSTLSLVPGSNPFTLQGNYIIDDPMLPGGIYQLRFRASDGINVVNKFIELQIHELERQMLYPVIITHPEQNEWQAYKLITNGEWKEFHTQTGDYIGSAVNSAVSQFYMCGIVQSDLNAIKLPGGEALWSVKPRIDQSQRWFEGVTFNYPNLYICTAEGNVRAYDKTGNEIYKSETFSNAFPYLSVLTKNFVVGAFKDAFSNDRFLIAFHNSGGAMIYTKYVESEVACMLYLGSDNVLVFSNSNGQGEILLYNGSDNTLAPLHSFYNGNIYKAVAMDSENYIVSTSNGLYRYQFSNNSLTPFVSSVINGNIACDNTSQLVYVTSGKALDVYSFPVSSLVETYNLPDTAIDLHLVFNK
jgi:hypothetical protein